MPPPYQYERYLRLTAYTLRDANWSPDFPTTARAVEAFWSLNGQPVADGVIAADPYLLTPLLRGMGPLTLDDGSQLAADQALPTLLARYYDGAVSRDKAHMGDMLPLLMQQLQQADLTALPALTSALETALSERHLQVVMNREPVAQVLADLGWDGGIRPSNSASLRVIDSDVGYGGVNAFVERLTHYDVSVDRQAIPLTATVTLTYTNRYSPWAEASTSQAVYGECTNPQTLQSARSLGCYADYVRMYIPTGSEVIEAQGFEETIDISTDAGHMVVGGYLRALPGEECVVRLSYSLPSLTLGTLTIEKQGGTEAPPILLTLHSADHQAALYTSGRTDLTLPYTVTTGLPVIHGPADPTAAATFARNRARDQGLVQWQAHDYDGAIKTWQASNAFDLVLDYARTLAPAEALPLMQAIGAQMQGGRAAFEEATLRAVQGDGIAAAQLYERAAAQSPENPLALLTRAQQRVATARPVPPLDNIPAWSSAVRRWLSVADQLDHTGAITDAVTHVAVLLQLTPRDRALALRLADLRLRAGQRDAALAAYASLATSDDVVGQLANARRAQLSGDHDTAAKLYVAVLPLATTYPLAFRVGDGLRELGDIPHALQAYRQAAAAQPSSLWPLLAAGNIVRGTNPAAARDWYERARKVDATSMTGYPDYYLGTLLLEQGNGAAARPLLDAALGKQPNNKDFQAAVARLSSAP